MPEENPNCRKTYATFRLAGSEVDPDQITKALGLEATGIAMRSTVGSNRPVVWSLSSKSAVRSTSLESHLLFLLDKLEPASERLRALVESQSHVEVDFFCYWLSASGHGGPSISAKTLKRIASLGAKLDFDIYFDR